MSKLSYLALLAMAVAVVAVIVSEAPVAEAVTCSPTALSPCLPAIRSGTAPTSACCSKLREQKPCFCGYLKNPNLRPYINSPNAKKVAASCGISLPQVLIA